MSDETSDSQEICDLLKGATLSRVGVRGVRCTVPLLNATLEGDPYHCDTSRFFESSRRLLKVRLYLIGDPFMDPDHVGVDTTFTIYE